MARLDWDYADFHGQASYRSKCGDYHIFWSDDGCCYMADAPGTNSHGGWETAREAKSAMQAYESNGRIHLKEQADG